MRPAAHVRTVAIAGDTAVIASKEDAYVFVRSGSRWSRAQLLISDLGSRLGDVALAGDTAIVGTNTSAHIFVRSGTSWSKQQTLMLARTDRRVVAMTADTALINGNEFAYVFARSGDRWREVKRLGALDAVYNVALSGQLAAVGTPWDTLELYRLDGNVGAARGPAATSVMCRKREWNDTICLW
jgi:hypothetical protein